MKKIFIPLLCFLVLLGCKNAEEKSDNTTSEKEEGLAQENNKQVSTSKNNAKEANIAQIEFRQGESVILDTDSLNAKIHLTKKSISIDLTEGKNKITLIIRWKEPFSKNPIEGIFQESPVGNDKMALMMGTILEEGSEDNLRDIPTAYEGTLVITKLTESEVMLEISGKGTTPSAMPVKSSWQPISVKVLCKNPQITASGGIKKRIHVLSKLSK